MSISKIKKNHPITVLKSWSGAGETTLKFPSTSSTASYLLVCGQRAATIYLESATNATITSLNNYSLTITPTGTDWEFKISGLAWYTWAFMIGM